MNKSFLPFGTCIDILNLLKIETEKDAEGLLISGTANAEYLELSKKFQDIEKTFEDWREKVSDSEISSLLQETASRGFSN